jgi:hypothetical protein
MPFIDPDHIDQRRAEFRLLPLADQLQSYNIQWDLEQYKKDLPMLEEKLKNTSK